MYEKYVELRDLKKETDYRVAKSTGVSASTLSNWKKHYETSGKEGYVPKTDKIGKIATHFGVSVDELLGRRG